jgi:flavin-dependent dehydrogenase
MIAPLCGDGIGMALSSAAIATPWIASALTGRIAREQMVAGYAAGWRHAFNRPLAIAVGLQRALLDPRSASLLLKLGRAWPPLVDWLVSSTRDNDLAGKLRRASTVPQAGAAR